VTAVEEKKLNHYLFVWLCACIYVGVFEFMHILFVLSSIC